MTQSCFLGEAKGHFKLQSNFRQTQNLYWRYYSGFLCCCCYLIAKLCPTLLKPQAPLSMGFPRQQYWSGLPFPPPGDLPHPGLNPPLLSFQYWQADSLPLSHQGIPLVYTPVIEVTISVASSSFELSQGFMIKSSYSTTLHVVSAIWIVVVHI